MQNVELDLKSRYLEAFRTIKTNVKYSTISKNDKVILVTSPCSGEGKTTIAINLALTLAMDKKKVILVDCNFRNPSIHNEFDLDETNGLSEVLVGKKQLNSAISKFSMTLDILKAGSIKLNPLELLDSEAMNQILNELRVTYDYVIIDSSSDEKIADSKILSSKVDGTIIVSRYAKTKRDELLSCKNYIEQVNGKVIGVIINRTKI